MDKNNTPSLEGFLELQNKNSFFSDKTLTRHNILDKLKDVECAEANLIRDVISFEFSDKKKEYKSYYTDGFSRILTDFSNSELNFFYEISEHIINPILKARIIDVLLERNYEPVSSNRFILYKDVVSKYSSLLDGLSKDNYHYRVKDINRALYICKMMGNKFDSLSNEIVEKLIQNIKNDNNSKFCINLLNIIRISNIENKRDELLSILLSKVETEENYYRAYDLADECYSLCANTESRSNIINKQVQIVKKLNGTEYSSHYYEELIKKYKSFSKNDRGKYLSSFPLKEYEKQIKDNNINLLKNCGQVENSIDLSKYVNDTVNSFKGKSISDSIYDFVFCLGKIIDIKQIKNQTKDCFENQSLCTSLMTNSIQTNMDGTIPFKSEWNINNGIPGENDSPFIKFFTDVYCDYVKAFVLCCINPALDVIVKEHEIDYSLIVELVTKYSIVDRERIDSVSRGLFYGFKRDYITSLSILIPQFENIIRTILKEKDIEVYAKDNNGFDTPLSLNSLIDKEETKRILGEDLCYEIRILLCEKGGVNLRNLICHGMFDDDEIQKNFFSVYFGWFFLSFILKFKVN